MDRFFSSKVNLSSRKIYILRPNQDQLQKMQLQGLRLDQCSYTDCDTEAIAVSLGVSSVYTGGKDSEGYSILIYLLTTSVNAKYYL